MVDLGIRPWRQLKLVDVSSVDSNVGETPSWAQVILDAFEARLCEVHTAIPGKVEKYDKLKGVADIQPLLKRKFKDGEVVDLPICNQVPVCFPRTTTSYIHLPIKKGDVGLLIFSERSVDRYKNLGGSQDPQDPRKHSLSDGFFIPGGYPITAPPSSVVQDALHFKNVSSEVIMYENGQIELKNSIGSVSLTNDGKFSVNNGVAELVDLMDRHYTRLSEILDHILALTVPTGVGPSGTPLNFADFASDKVDVEAMKAELGSFKV